MITWLASYPKSGNTWVRSFLAAYAFSEQCHDSFDLKLLSHISESESRAEEYAKIAGVPVDNLTSEQIDGLRAEVQRRLARSLRTNQVVKTHNARVMHNGTPLIAREYTDRAVYVVRNPLDVVDSLADHYGLSISAGIDLLADRRHVLGRSGGLVPQYLDSWSNHVTSWIKNGAFAVHVVRYEDLLEDPVSHFRGILEFLRQDILEDRLSKAIVQTSFEALSEKERQDGFVEVSRSSTSGTFFRRGKREAWRSLLTPEQIGTLLEHHAEAMQLAGYAIPNVRKASSGCPARECGPSHVFDAKIHEQVASNRPHKTPPAQLSVPAEWKHWIAENLLRGSSCEELTRILIENGFPDSLSRLEVDTAHAHPYVTAARSVLEQSSISRSAKSTGELNNRD